MDAGLIVGILMFMTLGAGLVFALRSKKEVEERMDEDTTKSTLAADKDAHGKPADV